MAHRPIRHAAAPDARANGRRGVDHNHLADGRSRRSAWWAAAARLVGKGVHGREQQLDTASWPERAPHQPLKPGARTRIGEGGGDLGLDVDGYGYGIEHFELTLAGTGGCRNMSRVIDDGIMRDVLVKESRLRPSNAEVFVHADDLQKQTSL